MVVCVSAFCIIFCIGTRFRRLSYILIMPAYKVDVQDCILVWTQYKLIPKYLILTSKSYILYKTFYIDNVCIIHVQVICLSRYIKTLHWKHQSKDTCTILEFRTTFLLLFIPSDFCFCNKNPQNIIFQTCNDFRRYVTWGKGNAWRNECRYNNTRANKKVRCKKAVSILCTP